MEILVLLLIFVLSFFIEAFGIIGGLSGGVLLVPLLHFVFGVPFKQSVGTVMLSLGIPSAIATIGSARRREVDYKLGLIFQIPAAIGAVLGALLVIILPVVIMQAIFGLLALVLSRRMLSHYKQALDGVETTPSSFWNLVGRFGPHLKVKTDQYDYTISIPALIVFGFLIGLISGMMGIGAGWLQVPLLIIGFGVPPLIASGTSLFVNLLKSITGGVTHFTTGNFNMEIFLVLSVSLPLGALMGNHLRGKLRNHHVSLVIGLLLLLVAMTMILSVLALLALPLITIT